MSAMTDMSAAIMDVVKKYGPKISDLETETLRELALVSNALATDLRLEYNKRVGNDELRMLP